MPAINKEERTIILYALVRCGGRGSHGRIIDYILSNSLMRPRIGDEKLRANGKTAIVNDLEFAREDLKESGYLFMPEIGIWAITEEGRKKVEEIALKIVNNRSHWNNMSKNGFVRIGKTFLDAMEDYARNLKIE